MGGQLLQGIKAFYQNASSYVRVDGELSDSFNIKVGVRQGCVMSLWLFNEYMDGVISQMKAKVVAKMELEGEKLWMVTSLFADDPVLFAES